VRRRPCDGGTEADYRASTLPGPVFGLDHQRASDSQSPVRHVDDESADQRKRFRIDMLNENNVDPSGGTAVDIRDEESLIVTRQNPRKPIGSVFLGQVVTELLRQPCYVSCI